MQLFIYTESTNLLLHITRIQPFDHILKSFLKILEIVYIHLSITLLNDSEMQLYIYHQLMAIFVPSVWTLSIDLPNMSEVISDLSNSALFIMCQSQNVTRRFVKDR